MDDSYSCVLLSKSTQDGQTVRGERQTFRRFAQNGSLNEKKTNFADLKEVFSCLYSCISAQTQLFCHYTHVPII